MVFLANRFQSIQKRLSSVHGPSPKCHMKGGVMSASILFVVGIGITLLASLAIVIYMQGPLRAILTELCGTAERADFWLAFSNVALTLAPLIFAASCTPDPRGSTVIEIAAQLKWGFIGLLIALITIGWVISRFIPRQRWTSMPQQSSSTAAA